MAEWYEQLHELQLRRNREIWAGLQAQGVDEQTELRLGFVYASPGLTEARELAAFLREETDYDVEVRARDEHGGEEDWVVMGATQPTAVSLQLLDDWVEWMIAAGAAEGPCAFDGWAAQLVTH